MAAMKTVAVTGASGYIGSFVVAECLARGYAVRGLVRGCTNNPGKAAHLTKLPHAANLTLVDGGDLSVPGSFDAAFQGASAVIHTAAAVVLGKDKSIVTASVDGTMNVLESVDRAPTVKQFVHTSSIAAIQTYDKPDYYEFTESDWNDWSTLANGDAYGVAKTEAERLVHKHFKNDAQQRTAVALNPGVVIGPVLAKAHTKASAIFLREICFNNKVLQFPSTYVDVRDVAAAHVNALEGLPGLHGKRFVLTNDTPCLEGGAVDLATRFATPAFPDHSFEGVKPKIPPFQMTVFRALSHIPVFGHMCVMTAAERAASITPINFDNTAARTEPAAGGLGIKFRPLEMTVKDGIESIVEQGFAKLKPNSRL